MNHISKCLMAAALAAPVLAGSSAWAQWSTRDARLGDPDYPYDAAYNPGHWGIYGYPYQYYDYAYYPYGGLTYPTQYTYDYTSPFGFLTAPFTAAAEAPVAATVEAGPPVVTGRSVAVTQPGNHCTTQVRICELYNPSFVGNGCSCRVPGGQTRGLVTP